MPIFLPVQYHARKYPAGIVPVLTEVAGHFDVRGIAPRGRYSLHTEYAAGARRFACPALEGLDELVRAHVRGVPMLWAGPAWVREFGDYLVRLCEGSGAPDVIEVHPPFAATCPDVEEFVRLYAPFERAMDMAFPGAQVVIENRHGTRHTASPFVLRKRDSLLDLSRTIDREGLALRLCLDVPQLFTAHYGPAPRTPEHIDRVLLPLMECRHNVASVHLWGKRLGKNGAMQAHMGTLDTWLGPALRDVLLERLCALLDDDIPRWFVPEVNSSQGDMEELVGCLMGRFRFS